MTTQTVPPPSPFDEQLALRLLHQRIVVLGTEVDDAVATRIVSQLLLLSAEDARADISLYINSPGGSVTAGMAIYDTMQMIPNEVGTLAMGLAASMGQILLCAGAPGKRFALPHSRILMHQGSAGVQGTTADVEIQERNLRQIEDMVNGLLARHIGKNIEQIEADSDRDHWFSAEQAREYGMVDRVLDSAEQLVPVSNRRAGL
ncbi:ATP-dependent Clp protease protease subunit [Psychromicrobium silvestre]|uniref:ATP-dependent Clp protease proteolytic subunit n=1 Tax=Psychromicrobium silvestre TaxID=1645614 RepID=A0A7Y9LSR6_9MICC|nr:ATP-dependent Clp protease proteolytic subunit [Psychromicrobium silvestre]NYE94918.1 ATP-dependent Clp protease protease subunit [Psychromicrobium silvestre]